MKQTGRALAALRSCMLPASNSRQAPRHVLIVRSPAGLVRILPEPVTGLFEDAHRTQFTECSYGSRDRRADKLYPEYNMPALCWRNETRVIEPTQDAGLAAMTTEKTMWKRIWKRLLLRGVHYADRHVSLNNLYLFRNPWDLASAREIERYRETNRIILQEFGVVTNLLEIGCGEGYQSLFLRDVCVSLHGLDVSRRAVHRARRKVPNSHFDVGSILDPSLLKSVSQFGNFDLVTAFEVLYYVKSPVAFVQQMASLGNAGIISYHRPQSWRLDNALSVIRFSGRTNLIIRDSEWTLAWWRNSD